MTATRRAELIISIVALAMGIAGFTVARSLSFTAPKGELVLSFGPSFNSLGAAVVTALGALALAGEIWAVASAGAFVLVTSQVLLQIGRFTNWAGKPGIALAFAVGKTAGLGALALTDRERP